MHRCLLARGMFLILVLVSGNPRRLFADDWPTYLNGNQRVGATDGQIADQLHLQWVHDAPSPPQTAWPGPRSTPIEGHVMRHRVDYDAAFQVAIAGERLYYGSSVDHQLYCVDAATGSVHWTYFADGPIRLCPTLWNGSVYSGSDDGFVYCLDAQSGDLKWRYRAGPSDERILARGNMVSRWPVRTDILIDDGIAYFGAGVIPHERVFLCALDARTGEIVWKNGHISHADAGRNDLSPQGYLLCNEDLLFVPSGRNLPTAFDRKTGELVHSKKYSWRTSAGGVVGGHKAVLADGQIYSAGPHHFLAMNQQTGAIGYAFVTGRQLTLGGDRAFVATGGQVVCLDRPQHVKATRDRQKVFLQQYDLRRKSGVIARDEYQQRTRDLADRFSELSKVGQIWTVDSPLADALVLTKTLVAVGGVGQVALLDRETGDQTWETKVDGTVKGLAVANGRLYASTDSGQIYCFGPASVASVKRHGAIDQTGTEGKSDDEALASKAREILADCKTTRGFCLMVGVGSGGLAEQLARQSELKICGVDSDVEQVQRVRKQLAEKGLYGSRVMLIAADPNDMPFANYFANVVVSEAQATSGKWPGDVGEAFRCVKPCGGVICVRKQADSKPTDPARSILESDGVVDESTDRWLIGRRGKLPGAGDWTHQYGDPSNTCMSQDERVRDGLSVLWYGDPGPEKIVNRHQAAAAPLSANGRMFIQGIDRIMAYDAYNGLFLWQHENPGAVRTGVFNNEETSNLAASDDALFVCVENTCTVLDAATGKVRKRLQIPAPADKIRRHWSYIAHHSGTVIGASAIRSELARALRRRGLEVKNATDAVFAVDVDSGDRIWTYRGSNIIHQTIAMDDQHVYLIESSITDDQRKELLRQDKTELAKFSTEQAKQKEAELKALDVRTAVALDISTGKKLWARPVDVTNCSHLGIGGGQLMLMCQDGHVIICGANANGHYWKQFLSGQFNKRRLLVLDSKTGDKLWARDANYRHRPIVVRDEIVAEPYAFNLHTGKPKTRIHPVTGEESVWQFSRPGHHCGGLTATPNMLFFRSGFTGYYDMYQDSGVSHFAGHRMGCWVNAIPGNGLLMIPESSAGCVCQFSLAATIVMEPRAKQDNWRIYSAAGPKLPVKHLALNLGGPGDRRDKTGRLWFGFPRPKTVGRLEYDFDIDVRFASGGNYAKGIAAAAIESNTTPNWLHTSGARRLRRCSIPLRDAGSSPAKYDVTLYLQGASREAVQQQLRVQGTSASSESIASDKETTEPWKLVVNDVEVDKNLVIEMSPATDATNEPLDFTITALEIVRR